MHYSGQCCSWQLLVLFPLANCGAQQKQIQRENSGCEGPAQPLRSFQGPPSAAALAPWPWTISSWDTLGASSSLSLLPKRYPADGHIPHFYFLLNPYFNSKQADIEWRCHNHSSGALTLWKTQLLYIVCSLHNPEPLPGWRNRCFSRGLFAQGWKQVTLTVLGCEITTCNV